MTIHIVTGPPCAGKSTYVRNHAKEGDVRVDFDLITRAFGSSVPHGSTGEIRSVAFAARTAAIDYLLEKRCESWIIHTSPRAEQMSAYEAAGADFISLDPGIDVCLARAKLDNRPDGDADEIRGWYENRENEKSNHMAHKIKDFAADIKAAGDDGGSIVAYASTFDQTPDSYGDIVAKGAFVDTLAAWKASGKPIPLLFNHDTNDPFHNIGAVTDAEEDDTGLKVTATLDPDNPTAQYVRSLVKQGRVSKMSFAYDVLQSASVTLPDGREANELQKMDLFEVSIVPIPANQNADILEVKNGDKEAIMPIDMAAAKAFINLMPQIKSGRVLSKSVEDKLSQASTLINDVLALVKDADGSDDEEKHREPDGFKDADIDRELVKKIEELTK